MTDPLDLARLRELLALTEQACAAAHARADEWQNDAARYNEECVRLQTEGMKMAGALRAEATEQARLADYTKIINGKPVPVINPICLGRSQALRDAADRIEAAIRRLAAGGDQSMFPAGGR